MCYEFFFPPFPQRFLVLTFRARWIVRLIFCLFRGLRGELRVEYSRFTRHLEAAALRITSTRASKNSFRAVLWMEWAAF
jgi:hypothetical protein